MNQKIKEELVEHFSKEKATLEPNFDFQDSLIFQSNNNLYFVMEYLDCEVKDDFNSYAKLFSKDIATCLKNLFFIRNQFADFHIRYDSKKDISYHGVIFCSKEDFPTVNKTINLITSQDGHTQFSGRNSINITKLNNGCLISMNIALFYHVLDRKIFEFRNKLSDKHGTPISEVK